MGDGRFKIQKWRGPDEIGMNSPAATKSGCGTPRNKGVTSISEIRNTARFGSWSAPVALFCLLNTGTLRAQEIRVVAEPNQSIRMGRGGYVCEGRLTHTPIDATEDWTYEMVQCTGPIYNSYDYAALQSKLNHDELVRLNDTMDHLNRATQDNLDKQALGLRQDLKATIERRFQDLPADVLLSAEVQNLKKSLLEYVDQRVVPSTPPIILRPPAGATPRRTRPAPTSPPNQP
jgi:hypothetical protein